MRSVNVPVADLILDGQNPRHARAAGQREAIRALLEDAPTKLLALATHIVDNGISPLEALAVMPNERDLMTVLEGNRRVASLKLLQNPALARGHKAEKAFRELADRADVPDEVPCIVFASREHAKPWLELRHNGEQGGAGVLRWGAEAKHRFVAKRGTQVEKALAFLEAVTKCFPKNKPLLAHVQIVRDKRLTTLGRLVGDPYVRSVMGLVIEDGEFASHYRAVDIEDAVTALLRDLAGETSVTDVKTKDLRRKYAKTKLEPEVSSTAKFASTPTPLSGQRGGKRVPARRRKSAKARAPGPLFEGVELHNLGSRVSLVLAEVRKLDLDQFPNAAGILTRAVVELAATEYAKAKTKMKPKQTLRVTIQNCLRKIDPSYKKPEFSGVRSGLADKTSVLAVATLHEFVHNPNYHPKATEIRAIAATYSAFLTELDRTL